MDVMDRPFTFDPLSRPPVPSLFGAFSGGGGCGGAPETEPLKLDEFDAYLHAIGVLPPLPPADVAPTPYSTPVSHAAALDFHLVQPAVDMVAVPPKLPERAVPVPNIVASKNSTARQRLCSDYDADIDKNLKTVETHVEERPLPDYLKTAQGDQMSPSTRASLVIWMEKFARHYDLPPGTLHSAVAYVDRVLSARTLTTHIDYKLRLLGAAAVFTAAKYEDQRTRLKLNATEIAWYCGFATSEEVLDMERSMVAALKYRLGGPTAYTFVGHFTRYSQGEDDLMVQRLAHRLADQSLLNYACLCFLPSAVAASAIFLARLALNPPDVLPWSAELQELTGYDTLDLSSCVRAMYSSQPLICNPHC